MRIVAGRFRSRRLKAVGSLALRPTSDQLRETLFNVLGADVSGSTFIDCYAGTGAVGIEALSRSARRVMFIEKDRRTSTLLRANLALLGVEPIHTQGGVTETEILAMDAAHGLLKLSQRNLRADFLFADPPYDDVDLCVAGIERASNVKNNSHLLAPGALVVIEHRSRKVLPEALGSLMKTRILKQGDSSLSFFRVGTS
jgi:16S rRNA (guanine(966)-N(2))-methyltransferase RsmD